MAWIKIKDQKPKEGIELIAKNKKGVKQKAKYNKGWFEVDPKNFNFEFANSDVIEFSYDLNDF